MMKRLVNLMYNVCVFVALSMMLILFSVDYDNLMEGSTWWILVMLMVLMFSVCGALSFKNPTALKGIIYGVAGVIYVFLYLVVNRTSIRDTHMCSYSNVFLMIYDKYTAEV